MFWHFTLSGFLVGGIVGLTGVGGGSLMTPLLVLLFGIAPTTAVGTDLLYACLTKVGGAAVHGRNGTVDWRITARLAAGSVPAALLTLFGLDHLHRADILLLNRVLTTALGAALILTAVAMTQQHQITRWGRVFAARRAARGSGADPVVATIVTGAVLGVLVTLSSVGAGALGVAVLFFLYPELPAVRIVGSDIAHAVPLTMVAGIGHFALGGVDLEILAALLLGSVPAVILASRFAPKVPDRLLRYLLAAVLAVVGVRLFF